MGEPQPPRYVLGTTPDCFVEYSGKSSLKFPTSAFSTSPECFTEYSGSPTAPASPISSTPGPTVASDFIADMFGASSSSPVWITSLPNERGGKPGEKYVPTRIAEKIEDHLREWDGPGRALYFCTATVKTGAMTRSKSTISELNCIFTDIDFKHVSITPEEILKILNKLQMPPSIVVHSGHGFHCYWLLNEAIEATTESIPPFENILWLLADHLGGDYQCCEASRLMRLPGSHNTKDGEWVEVKVIVDRPLRYELKDLREWLTDVAMPVIKRKPRDAKEPRDYTASKTSSADRVEDENPFIAYAESLDTHKPIDVEQRLADMRHEGPDDAAVHLTQLDVTRFLVDRGDPLDEIVARVLAATQRVPGSANWNWRVEEKNIRDMAVTWREKREKESEQEQGPDAQPQPDEFAFHWHGEISVADSRPWLIQDVIPEVGSGLVAGQWGTLKTFAVLDMANAIMTGQNFIEFEVVRRGGVLFIAAEGGSEITIRLQGVLDEKNGPTTAPFVWTESCPILSEKNAVKRLTAMATAAAAQLKERFDLPLVLIAIDTIVAAAGHTREGADNDTTASQVIMRVMAQLARNMNCFVVGLEHFGKDVNTGTRGSSVKEGSTDVVVAMLGEKNTAGQITNTRLALRKRRGGENGLEFPFKGRVVDMGTDTRGKQMSTLVLDWGVKDEAPKAAKDDWGNGKGLRLLRQAMMGLLVDCGKEIRPWAEGPTVRALDAELVRAEFYKGYFAEGATPAAKQTARRQAFHRAVAAAADKGVIVTRVMGETTYVWLTTKGDEVPPK
jgi:AAA domain